PELLGILSGCRGPQVLPKLAAAFVNRNSMTANCNIWIVHRVRQMQGIVNPSHRADCVPDPQKVRPAFTRERLFETGGYLERVLIADFGSEPSNCVWNQRVITLPHQTEHVEEGS